MVKREDMINPLLDGNIPTPGRDSERLKFNDERRDCRRAKLAWQWKLVEKLFLE